MTFSRLPCVSIVLAFCTGSLVSAQTEEEKTSHWIELTPAAHVPVGSGPVYTYSAVPVRPEGSAFGLTYWHTCDPADVRRAFRIEKTNFLLGEPILIEWSIHIEGEGNWTEASGGDYRSRGRKDNFLFLLRHEDGEWVRDSHPGHGGRAGGLVGGTSPETYNGRVSEWNALQRWCAIERPGNYDLFCIYTGPITAHLPSRSPLYDQVLSHLQDYFVQYKVNPKRQYETQEGTKETVNDIRDFLKRATTFAHFKISIRDASDTERVEMVDHYVRDGHLLYQGRGRKWHRALQNGIFASMQSDFYDYIAGVYESVGKTGPLYAGLLSNPDPRFTALVLHFEPDLRLAAYHYAYNPSLPGNLVDLLDHDDDWTSSEALKHLRYLSGAYFLESVAGVPRQPQTITTTEKSNLKRLWSLWWEAEGDQFYPRWTGKRSVEIRRPVSLPTLTDEAIQKTNAESTVAVTPEPYEENSKWGYRYPSGEVLVEASYESASSFKSGYAIVQKNGFQGVIDLQGRLLVPIQYDKLRVFAHRDYIEARRGGKQGRLNLNGETIISFEFDYIGPPTGKLSVVSVGRRAGVWSDDGHLVVPLEYESIHLIDENLAIYRLRYESFQDKENAHLYGLLNIATNEPITEPQHHTLRGFYGNRLMFSRYNGGDERYGLVDRKGNIVVDAKFSYLSGLRHGLAEAAVETDGKYLWGFVDSSGEFVIGPKFRRVRHFSEDLAVAEIEVDGESRFGYVDRNGDWVIEPIYLGCAAFNGGVARVWIEDPIRKFSESQFLPND